MRILVVGGGGREHALVWKLAQSRQVEKIYCAPGNPGIAALAECVDIAADDVPGLVAWARRQRPDLTVVGPEQPLALGVADALVDADLAVFGPSQAAAELESSKAFAKQFMARHGIPTAAFRVFADAASALAYVRQAPAPLVVKADGLAAGKGVVVAATRDDAAAAVRAIMQDQQFGAAGARVVIEECLTGEEASVLAFCDGTTVVPMVAAQDHKRAFDGDRGPNTGGMGAYAPAPVVTPVLARQVREQILAPVVRALRQEGRPYRGVLYAGLMITAAGPRVIEFNVRFGDPETQAVLPLLDGDLAQIMLACAAGRLDPAAVRWHDGSAACVVMASRGYPGAHDTGKPITGLEAAAAAGALVFHAGTARRGGQVVTAGGRVLGVTAVAPDIAAAVRAAYRGVAAIHFDGAQFRRDIAWRALARR